jgi:hypothetical protein
MSTASLTDPWVIGSCWSCAIDRLVILDESINETLCEDCLSPLF